MRGHDALKAMRRRRERPEWVFLYAGDSQADFSQDWQVERPGRAHIQVMDSELISSLDLRCVVGMPVLITGDDKARLNLIADACVECGASRVVVGHVSETTERECHLAA